MTAAHIGSPAERLAALVGAMGVDLGPAVAGRMLALLDRMALEPQNLTAIDPLDGGIERHLADSLSGMAVEALRLAPQIVDIGSGGGFPGLPLAMLRPDCAVTLVESERRKAEWLARAAVDLPNVRIVADRAERLASGERESWAAATARAVAPLPVVLELAAPLVRVGGSLVVWRGPRDAQEEERAAAAAPMLGFAPGQVRAVEPFPGADRTLHEFLKVEPSPAKFPRRPGRAGKRPLA
jgi:16S rRNA (guanine527-N7)-methyltransferase